MDRWTPVLVVLTLILTFCNAEYVNDNADQIVQCQSNQYPPSQRDEIPKYVINLDLPPEQRWSQVVMDKKLQVLNLLEVFQNFTNVIFPGKLFKFVDKYLPLVAHTLPEPYYSELKGISNLTGIPLGEITLYNIFYEIFSVCTSLVAQRTDGHLFHGRNLDFGLLLGWDVKNHTWQIAEALRPLVVALDFQKANKTIFKSINYAGQIGILTGLKPHLFSLSLDRRFHLDGGAVALIRWLMGDRSAQWTGFLMRSVLEEATEYEEALNVLTNTKLLAPVYFIIGSNASQAAVVTRGRNDAELWSLGNPSISQNSTWYVVETNYDHWKKPPFYDDRRTPAIYCMDKTGQSNISLLGLYNVLSTQPVLNKLTTYTSLMDVSTGKLETWLRYCPDPCAPW